MIVQKMVLTPYLAPQTRLYPLSRLPLSQFH